MRVQRPGASGRGAGEYGPTSVSYDPPRTSRARASLTPESEGAQLRAGDCSPESGRDTLGSRRPASVSVRAAATKHRDQAPNHVLPLTPPSMPDVGGYRPLHRRPGEGLAEPLTPEGGLVERTETSRWWPEARRARVGSSPPSAASEMKEEPRSQECRNPTILSSRSCSDQGNDKMVDGRGSHYLVGFLGPIARPVFDSADPARRHRKGTVHRSMLTDHRAEHFPDAYLVSVVLFLRFDLGLSLALVFQCAPPRDLVAV